MTLTANAASSRPGLVRANTDLGPRGSSPQAPSAPKPDDEENWQLRHGYEDEYNSEEYLAVLNSVRGTYDVGAWLTI